MAKTIANNYRNNSPEKVKAHSLVNNKVAYGEVIKPTICEHCSAESYKLQAHHTDYSKPLEVIWLCTKCHGKQHRRIKDD
jgi:RNase P subunit RPR2